MVGEDFAKQKLQGTLSRVVQDFNIYRMRQ